MHIYSFCYNCTIRKTFCKKCVVQLARFEPMSSCLDSCIQNTKFQMHLMISLICVKVSELWNSNAISENTNKVLVRARFQQDTYVICIWITLNTVWVIHNRREKYKICAIWQISNTWFQRGINSLRLSKTTGSARLDQAFPTRVPRILTKTLKHRSNIKRMSHL